MKTGILIFISALILGMSAHAADLSKLDKLSTCVTEAQKVSANQVLTLFENFKWWKIKNIMDSLHPEYKEWHASRVYLATLYPPETVAKLPYKNGIVSKDNYPKYLANVAYSNDVPKYAIDINRVECISDDTVVVSSIFNGTNVYRNADGVALYQTSITNLPTRFLFTVKDGLIYRNIVDLTDGATKKMVDELTVLVKAGVTNVTPGSIPNRKLDDFIADFEKQAKE